MSRNTETSEHLIKVPYSAPQRPEMRKSEDAGGAISWIVPDQRKKSIRRITTEMEAEKFWELLVECWKAHSGKDSAYGCQTWFRREIEDRFGKLYNPGTTKLWFEPRKSGEGEGRLDSMPLDARLTLVDLCDELGVEITPPEASTPDPA